MLGCLNPNLGQIWTNPNVVKNVISKFTPTVLFYCIFNPTLGFVHILPKFGLKQLSIFLEFAEGM